MVQNNFTFNNNTYFQTVKDSVEDRLEIEIGDSKQPDFKPQIKIKRWDNEVNFSCRLIDDEPKLLQEDGEKIKLIGNKKEVHFYNIPKGERHKEGGFEFEVILKEKSQSNVLEFSIETKELDFFYQLPLTQKEIEDGHICPQNVAGSYAVYHKTKKDHRIGSKNYRCGKAFHIYRPKIVDIDGVEVWGELNINIENKLLIVTIPQEFLDVAVYPIVIDPTFGYEGIGGLSFSYSLDAVEAAKGTPTDGDGTVDKITVYARSSTGDMKGLIILDSTKNIVADGISPAQAMPSFADWTDLPYSSKPSVTDSVVYYVGIIAETNITLYYDTSAPNGSSIEDTANSFASPENLGAISSKTSYKSIYATYSTGVSVSPSVSLSPSFSSSVSPSISLSPSLSPSFSPSFSPSVSPSVSLSPSFSPSVSPSISLSPSASPSISISPSVSPSPPVRLDETELKRPKTFKREFIYQKQDYTAIDGKSSRDVSNRKEKFVLTFENLTPTQVDTLLALVAQDQALLFTYDGEGMTNVEATCFPYIGSIDYVILGNSYLANLTLELIEES